MADVFISYSRKDIAFAHILVDALKSNQLETWIDWEDIPPSADWLAEIYQAIESSDTFVYIVSQNSKNSEVCSKEIQHATENQKRLVPIVIHPEIKPNELPPNVAALNWIFFPDSAELSPQAAGFQQAFDKLLIAIKTDLDWVKLHTRLQVRALEWQKNHCEPSFTLRGRELSEAEAWLAQTDEKKTPQPTGLQRQYVLDSRKGADRRQRTTLGAVSIGLIIAITLAIVAIWQSRIASANERLAQQNAQAEAYARSTAVAESHTRATAEYDAVNQRATAVAASTEAVQQRDEALHQANLALAGKLAAQSQLLFKNQLDLALLLSIEASNTADTNEARLSPRLALEYSPRLLHILKSNAIRQRAFAISPDGQTLAIAECTAATNELIPRCAQGQVVFIDFHSGQRIGQPINLGQFSAGYLAYNKLDGGKTLILVGYSSVEIFDINARSVLGDYPTGQKETRFYPTAAAFSPDGNLLAIGSCGDRSKGGDANAYCNLGEIRLWDIQHRQLYGQPIAAHDADIDALAFSPDDQLLASTSAYVTSSGFVGPIKFWDTTSPSEPFKLSGEPIETGELINALAFSPDGILLAAGGSENTITLWDTATHQISGSPLMGHTYQVSTLQFSPDGKTLASGSLDDTLILWDVARRKPVGEPLVGHTGDVLALAYSPDGQQLISADRTGTLMVWDTRSQYSGSPLGKVLPGTGTVYAGGGFAWVQAFSPDGNILAYSVETTIYLWDMQKKQSLGEALTSHADTVNSLVFPPQYDGKILVSASGDGATITWDVSTGQPILHTMPVNAGFIYHSAFTADRLSMAYIDNFRQIVIVDPATGAIRQELSLPSADGRIFNFAMNQDGRLMAALVCESLAQDNTCNGWAITPWDTINNRIGGAVVHGLASASCGLALSPDGTLLAYSDRPSDKIIIVDRGTGEVRAELSLPENMTFAENIVFSPGGKLMAASGSRTLILYDTATGKPASEPFLEQSGIEKPAFSPDGKVLAWPLDGTPFLWDITNQKALAQPAKTGDAGGSLAFSPDGKRISIGGVWSENYVTQGQAQVFDASSGQLISKLPVGHIYGIIDLSFNSDGEQLYTLSNEGTLDVWNLASQELFSQPIKGYLASNAKVDLSPDGLKLALVACKIKPAQDCLQSELWLQDTSTGELILQPIQIDFGVSIIRYSHDGKTLAIISGATVIVWDVVNQVTLHTLQDPQSDIGALAFSPGDDILATKSNQIILWDLAKGQVIGEPINDKTGGGNGNNLAGANDWGIAFSPDGQLLATTGGTSGSLMLVEVSSGLPYGGLLLDPRNQSMRGTLFSVAFSPDGKTLVSGSNYPTVIAWTIDPPTWRQMACEVAGRSLTLEEWSIYMPASDPYMPSCP